MNNKDYLIVATLGETRNITRTAERLFMTQSAISKRIKLIEQEFSCDLLVRSRHGIFFTKAGEHILDFCRNTLEELDALKQQVNFEHNEISGTLRVGYSISYGTYFLASQLASYHEAYPKVNLQVSTDQSSQLYTQMIQGSLDLAIIRGEYSWDGPKYILAKEQVYAVWNHSMDSKSLSECLYISRKTDPYLTNQMIKWLREKELFSNSSQICVDNITTCRQLVDSGIGWAILPEIALEHFDGTKMKLLFNDGTPFTRCTYILVQNGAIALPQIKYFINLILSLTDTKKEPS
ncbi:MULTISPECIES: LysR family transcriptional regulator [Dorea]|jgi:DNA-binding transcriptional LysR family regulator|uniref:LysR family transcriptional regulator n=1 Tax=Dorea formicigenerans TaxID=39486 RepID=A0A3E5ENN6_9FIRM|nr:MULTISPECIES: LysR family transcriptional regulator [Dorea]MCB6490662.1 LysR family transcriptional regulator [Dorea sp. 210702-DFI.3.17]MCB6508253.1 LysR family transcriptional regulator [Dorea sp. 210702-DFI.3.125]RGJ62915.1 LysR family transcriptional regulator [Dorea formicigenerans]RGN90333.1 LysR family transcriptional regulator [Dorea formicigenerans]RGT39391.1 LysR family transcriptional regulator [Dorea formicigenerans]